MNGGILTRLVKTSGSGHLEGFERSLVLGGLNLSGNDILGVLVETIGIGDLEGFERRLMLGGSGSDIVGGVGKTCGIADLEGFERRQILGGLTVSGGDAAIQATVWAEAD